MSIFKLIAAYISLALIASLFFTSCNKKPETIGLDLVDSNKPEVGYDTAINVRVYSSIEDSVSTDETSLSLFGSMSTQDFGRTSASSYTQLRLGSINPDWGDNPVADSVILSMVYSGYYGNITTQQHLRVYEVTELFEKDSSYWSNQSFETAGEELANYTFVPHPDDSSLLISDTDTSKIAAALRVPMSTDFANRIFTMDSSFLSSSEEFIKEFNGIYVKPDDVNAPGIGSISYFDLLNVRSNVTIYYHNDSLDSLNYPFLINSNNARVGHFDHDYSLSTNDNFINQVFNGDTTLGSEQLFLQCLGGVQTTVFFPDIKDWANTDGRLINQAKLVIPIYEPNENYPESKQLLLFEKQADGSILPMRDNAQGENYFDGKYNEDAQSYTFRISLYIQDLISGEPDNGLSLFPNAKSVKGTQIHLYGSNPLNLKKMQLQLIFTDPN